MPDQLYREQFMDVFKSDLNYGEMDSPTVNGARTNAVCGDKMVLQLKISNGMVEDARFNGVSCAVSKTAASLITEHLKGKHIEELKKLTEQEVLDLIKFELTSSRKQCALLSYYALQEALKEYEKSGN